MVTRINGFSGMDIDSLVKNMMATKRASYDKLTQEKQQIEWKRDSYREINSKLYTFRYNKLIDTFGKDSALNGYKAVQTGYTGALKAEATSYANGIDMKVKVNQLAESTTVTSVGTGEIFKGSSTLAEVNGVNLETLTESERKQYLDMGFDLTINGVSFRDSKGKPLFNGLTSISSMISTINSDSKANVSASYDEVTGKLIIKSKTSGPSGKVEIGAVSGSNGVLDLFGGASAPVKGKEAILEVNGVTVKRDSNNFNLNGIDFTLLTETPDGETVNVSAQTSPDKAVETVKSFVEEYNSLLDLLNTKVSQAKYRKFLPLTDEQKKEMKEADIKAWTEKSQSGLLRNDDILASTISKMREVITSNLRDLSDMGVTTGKYTEGGKLILDEVKLKNALEKNPQKVKELFQGTDSISNTGILSQLAGVSTNAINMISERAGTDRFSASLTGTYKPESVIGRELKSYNSRIDIMLKNLNTTENRYYKQFTAMEQAMSKLNSQSSSLLSSLGMKS
jgi:flagellar hook-associated protein 2